MQMDFVETMLQTLYQTHKFKFAKLTDTRQLYHFGSVILQQHCISLIPPQCLLSPLLSLDVSSALPIIKGPQMVPQLKIELDTSEGLLSISLCSSPVLAPCFFLNLGIANCGTDLKFAASSFSTLTSREVCFYWKKARWACASQIIASRNSQRASTS